jgi:LPS-assembly lipoprotein
MWLDNSILPNHQDLVHMSDLAKTRDTSLLRGYVSVVMLCVLLTGCGFSMQGQTPLPFDNLYIGIQENSKFGADMRRAFIAASPATKIEENPLAAQAQLQQLAYIKSMREVALNSLGQIEEYELTLRVTVQLTDAKGQVIMPAQTFTSVRNMPYDPNVIQAKEGEMATIFKDMERSMVSRIVRRVTSPDVVERAERLAATGTTELSGDPAQLAQPVTRPAPIAPDALQRQQMAPAPTAISK